MRNVKSKKANLENKRWVFFSTGLLAAGAMTLASFEWLGGSVYASGWEKEDLAATSVVEVEYLQEEAVVTPPQQPAATMEFRDLTNPEVEEVDNETSFEESNPVPTPPTPPRITDKRKGSGVVGITPEPPKTTPQTVVPVMPEFPGGVDGLSRFIQRNLDVPTALHEYGYRGKAQVYVQFVVDTKGRVSDVSIARDFGMGLDEAAIDVVKAMPNWTPGQDEWGRNVPVLLRLPIVVKLDE